MAHAKTYDQLAPKVAHLRRTRTSEEAAAMLGISRTQLRKIEAKAERDAAMPAWTVGLDIRTANILLAVGFTDKDQVRQTIEHGRDIDRVKALRLEIVREWLG